MFEECISTAGKIDKMLLIHNSPFVSVNVDKFFNLFCRGHVSGVFVIMFRWFSFLQSDENVAVSEMENVFLKQNRGVKNDFMIFNFSKKYTIIEVFKEGNTTYLYLISPRPLPALCRRME